MYMFTLHETISYFSDRGSSNIGQVGYSMFKVVRL